MKKELLSMTDENSILITAEFLASDKILSCGDDGVQRIELDLIVNKNITCGQLLEGIHKGLENSLNDMGIRPGTIAYSKIQKKLFPSKHSDISDDPISASMSEKEIKKRDALIEKSRRIEEELEKNIAINDDSDNSNVPTRQESYVICWEVFNECFEAYKSDYEGLIDISDPKKFLDQKKVDREKLNSHPVIGCGFYNSNAFDNTEEPEHTKGKASKKRISKKKKSPDLFAVSSRPQYWFSFSKHNECSLSSLGFITATRLIFDTALWHHSAPLFNEQESRLKIIEAFKKNTPNYNISDSPIKKLSDEEVRIIDPPSPPQAPKQNIIALVLPTVLSIGVLFAVRMLTSNRAGMLTMGLMSVAMGLTSLITGLVNRRIQKNEYLAATKVWKEQYEAYINDVLNKIVTRQKNDVKHLKTLYPAALPCDEISGEDDDKKPLSLVEKILTVDGDIYSRNQKHPDFLKVRLGVSKSGSHLTPSVFKVVGDKKEVIFNALHYKNILHQPKKPFTILKDKKAIMVGAYDGSEGSLINLPNDISERYRYLTDSPVLLDLEECGTLGIVYGDKKEDCTPFLDNILLDLCFHHSPEDLQCVIFFDETDDLYKQQDAIRNYKHLPHFHELLGNLSAFVFNQKDAHRVFNKLTEILTDRESAGGDTKFPHIVVFFRNEYDFKRHLFSQNLPEYSEDGVIKTQGLSFVFCTKYKEHLPKYCGNVIYMKDKCHSLLPHTLLLPNSTDDIDKQDDDVEAILSSGHYDYGPDKLLTLSNSSNDKEIIDDRYLAFKALSALHYERIAQGADMPSNVELFEMLREIRIQRADNTEGKSIPKKYKKLFEPKRVEIDEKNVIDEKESKEKIFSELNDYVKELWGYTKKTNQFISHRSVIKSLTTPIGKNVQGVVELDLHEKGDGPHMLVAGTTGSGKTETILTYLVNLCTWYTPEQVNLLLMDMKGEDFVRRIGSLPHVVGTVTDLDGDKTGTSAAYMLKRFLSSMNAEVKRRKSLLSTMGVSNINDYIEAKTNLQEHMKNKNIDQSKRKELEELEPMPHLFLVIDEFTELMQFTSENSGVDFKSAITSLARVGRSLGFHIILISQNIENAITSDIRVNSRARLCLRVATRDASKEMLGTDIAASPLMPGNGRAYLQVGNGSRFEYFQSAYSGANLFGSGTPPVVLTYAKPTGEYKAFYDSKKQEGIELGGMESDETKSGATQIDYLCAAIKNVFEEWHSNHEKPHQVFEQPLPTHCWYNWENKKFEDISSKMSKKEA